MPRGKYVRTKLGDVFAIPLPDGTFAFGRLYHEGALGIYKKRGTNENEIPTELEYDFFVNVYSDVLSQGIWKKVGNVPFKNGEDIWQPPKSVFDDMNNRYSLYIKGQMIPSTKEICEHLEPAAVWEAYHVVDRLMGDDKWLNDKE